LERLGIGYGLENGRNDDMKILMEIIKRCVDIEMQSIEATLRERERERQKLANIVQNV
jgi:hypothetical protein